MNRSCSHMQDRIADYVLGVLDPQQSEILREHLATCDACRQYVRSLEEQARSLVAFGSEIDADMEARQERVIEALQAASPADEGATRVFPFSGGFLKVAVAAVLVLGVGVGVGRWTAPQSSVDIEQLRADLQASVTASVAATVQESLLGQVDQRFDELVQIVEEARLKDRQRVAKALEQIEQNRLRDKAQIGMGLQSLAALTTKATPAVQH